MWTCCSSFPCPSFSKEAWDCSDYNAGVGAGGLRLQSHWSGLKATRVRLMCLQSNNQAAFEVWGVQRIEQAHGAASKNRLHPGSLILQCTAQVPAQVTNINPTLILQHFRQHQWKSWAGLLFPPAVQAGLTALLQCRSGPPSSPWKLPDAPGGNELGCQGCEAMPSLRWQQHCDNPSSRVPGRLLLFCGKLFLSRRELIEAGGYFMDHWLNNFWTRTPVLAN